ncbi:MAG: hypothetical protein JXB32_08940 [Deltaproteobacteria bacterium]|nr:hypothetical protein [Deltaproteobacteria bacterium]
MRTRLVRVWLLAGCCVPGAACDGPATPGTDGGDAGGDAGTSTYQVCPGGPGCAAAGATLEVGVARRAINPTIVETMTVDVNGNAFYEMEDGDEFDDVDGDTVFDGTWMAGLGGGPRPASGIGDDIETRVLALRSGDVSVVVVASDLIGLFYDDVERVREAVADLELDLVVSAASHNHEGPDTIGIWGANQLTSGVDPAYVAFVRGEMAAAIREAWAALEPAHVRYGSTVPGESPTKGVANVVSDSRDPCILNEVLTTLQFVRPADGSTIATLVNWTAHPEYSGDRTSLFSADYVHWLRDGIEEGVHVGATDVSGVGGTAVFVQGALGVQIGPGRVVATGLDGVDYDEDTPAKAEAVGRLLAVGALRAIAEAGAAEASMPLAFVRDRFELTIENYAYHAMLLLEVFPRAAHGYDPTFPLDLGNFPRIWTEICWLRLGRAQALTIGGEPPPEVFLGGYDGSHTPDLWPLVDLSRENPPDLALAPPPPYLFDELTAVDFPMAWGLVNDMLGYFVPAYDYELDAAGPYVEEAPGDHYEETNSVGPNAWPTVEAEFDRVLERVPVL